MKEMSTESNKIHFPAIDIVRFLCAFLVVAIHTAPFSSYHQTISNGFNNFLCRVAVPFYFGATGFFLCEKYKNSEFKFSYILPYLKKILIIYIAWTILYLSKIILMIRTFEGGITAGIMERIKLTVFSGSIVHLWYFTALLFAVSFLAFLFSKKVNIRIIVFSALGLYMIGLAGETYVNIFQSCPNIYNAFKTVETWIVTFRNGLFFGVPCVLVGVLVSKYKRCISLRKAVVFGSISFLCMFAEAFLVQHFYIGVDYNMYLFLLPVTFFLLYLCTMWEERDNSYVWTADLRNIGTLIFLIHPMLMKQYHTNSLIQYLLVCLFSFLISFIIVEISKYRYFKWMKKLY